MKHLSTKLAFKVIGIGICSIGRNFGITTNKLVHKEPWLFLGLEALVFISATLLYIGRARCERDNAILKSYNTELRMDSLEIDNHILKLKR